MATSKNNRKKGHKRAAAHAAPAGYNTKNPKQDAPQSTSFFDRHQMAIKWAGLIIMLIGFVMVYYYQLTVGYPITIVGALIGFFAVRPGARFQKLSKVCYAVYIALIVYVWVTLSL